MENAGFGCGFARSREGSSRGGHAAAQQWEVSCPGGSGRGGSRGGAVAGQAHRDARRPRRAHEVEWWRKYLRANGAWPGSCESDGCRRRGWDVICRGQRVAGHTRSSWWGGERGSRSPVAGVHRRDLSWLETNKFAPCVQSSPMWRDEIELLWLTWTQPSSSCSDCSTNVFGSPTRPVVRTSDNSDPLPALSSPAVPLHTLLVPHL